MIHYTFYFGLYFPLCVPYCFLLLLLLFIISLTMFRLLHVSPCIFYWRVFADHIMPVGSSYVYCQKRYRGRYLGVAGQHWGQIIDIKYVLFLFYPVFLHIVHVIYRLLSFFVGVGTMRCFMLSFNTLCVREKE